jgi:MoaA/NifB/PqqE/SkfB family radical SAM enzyme/alpha-beta hydrolase superfamily lysophospholipase
VTRNLGSAPPVGIVLVHGFLGSPSDLAPLAKRLAIDFGADSVENLCLPGHGGNTRPTFDEVGFLDALATAIDRHRGRPLVLVGHSTGGSLLLAEIARRLAARPTSLDALRLLVLCGTPPHIDVGYTQRWSTHTADRTTPLHDVGALVALVNRLARRGPLAVPAPVLIMHGEADELVPVADAELWRVSRLAAPQRHARVTGAGHHLFSGDGADLAVDCIRRAIDDADADLEFPRDLYDLLPGLEPFCATWPDSRRHLRDSPAGRRALGEVFVPGPVAPAEPTLANIEITTRCTLGCAACARTQLKLQSRFMSREDFARVLTQLPHAYRIVLVGLGEPLLHPEVVNFVKLAAGQGRRVGLVTNAMNLDADMARALCGSGLASLTFSLDALTQATAERVRLGSDMGLIGANIRGFMTERKRQDAKLGTAVFTALTCETLDEFEAIIDFVADHGIDALMVTDLNFPANQPRSVHAAFTPEHAILLRKALKHAVARRLPVLSVWGLEEFALDTRYLDFLLLRGEQLAHRAARRTNCLSPWQSIPVNVDGNLTPCDCQPGTVIGNIHRIPLSDWWNGAAMTEQRRRMLGDDPPEACLACPRF